jgi:uncharacterized protein YaiE (UPF0345 family)
MMPGEYTFAASDEELMEILAGDVDVLLSGKSDWISISAGQSFGVEENTKFDIKVKTLTDYCCSYIPA